jgi:hypothetical protein
MSLKQINKITKLGVVDGRDIALVTLNDDSKRLYYRSTGSNRGLLQKGRWCRFNGINLYDVCTEDGDCFIGNLIKPSGEALYYNGRCKWYIHFLKNQHPETEDLEYAFEDTQDVFVTSVLDEELPYSLEDCDDDTKKAYIAYSTTLSELYEANEAVKQARGGYPKKESKIVIEGKTEISKGKTSSSFYEKVRSAASFMAAVKENFDSVKLDDRSAYISSERIDEAAWAMTFERNFEDLVNNSQNDSDKGLLCGLQVQAKQYREDYYNRKCKESGNAFRENPEPLVSLEDLDKKHALISGCVGKSGQELIRELQNFQQEQLQQKLERALVDIKYINTFSEIPGAHKDRNQFIRDAVIWKAFKEAKTDTFQKMQKDNSKIYKCLLKSRQNKLEESAVAYKNSKKDYKNYDILSYFGMFKQHHSYHEKAKEVVKLLAPIKPSR